MDSAHPRRWKLVIGLTLVVVFYWLALFVATHVPMSATLVGKRYSLDKLEHLAAFATLAGLLSVLGTAMGIRWWKLVIGIVVVVAVYAIFDEATQSFVSSRSPDILDWLADLVGAGLGIALFFLVHLLLTRRTIAAVSFQPRPGNEHRQTTGHDADL